MVPIHHSKPYEVIMKEEREAGRQRGRDEGGGGKRQEGKSRKERMMGG